MKTEILDLDVKLIPFTINKEFRGIGTKSIYGVEMIKAKSIWQESQKGAGVKIAVIDSGCDINHESLKNNTYGDNENELYYNLFARAATLFSRDIKKSLGPESEDPTERLSFYKAQMAYYKKRTCVSGISQPKSTGPKIFYTDMHSNPPRQLGGVHNVP